MLLGKAWGWQFCLNCKWTPMLVGELVSFCPLDSNRSHMERENLYGGIFSIRLACGQAYGTFS